MDVKRTDVFNAAGVKIPAPQQYTCPEETIPQLLAPQYASEQVAFSGVTSEPLASIRTNVCPPTTATGADLRVHPSVVPAVTPLPSSPWRLHPQQNDALAVVAHECKAAGLTLVTALSEVIFVGDKRVATALPGTAWPTSFCPQQ
jgi:hypothetical protein